MLDKELIQKNFKKSISTYIDNAIAQKKIALRLINLIKEKKDNFDNILEIGSYSGLLTSLIKENINYKSYLALDIIEDSKTYLEKIDPEIKFLNSDIENFKTNEKFDLIVSNASLQWCEDFKSTILKLKSMKKNSGTLAISIFLPDNLYQIKEIFNISLKYLPLDELKLLFSPSTRFIKEDITLQFETPKDALRHLKLTGVNSVQKNNLTVAEIKKKLERLKECYQNQLTYKALYIID